MERRGTEVSALATGGRQALQRSEAPRARTVQKRQKRRDTACKAPHSGLSRLITSAAARLRLRYAAGA